jgi:hypothetical protein
LNAIETLAYSRYNAMMFRLSRRYANRLAVNFNYTWSKAMDLVDNDSDTIINPYNMRQNWAPAGYDQTNVITLDFVYDLVQRLGDHRNDSLPIGDAVLGYLERLDHGRRFGRAVPRPDR